MPFNFPICDNQDIYLIDVFLYIIATESPKDIEDVAVHLIDILGQPMRLRGLAEVSEQQF